MDFANVFASLSLQKAKKTPNPLSDFHLVPCNPDLSEDLFLNRGFRVIYEITAEPYCVLVTNCKDIPWDVSSNEHGIYYTTGKRGGLKPAGRLTATATSL